MDATQIIISPIVSEKSYVLATAGKYTFRVHDDAHKTQIKQAVEELRAAQNPDGSLDPTQHDVGRLVELVDRISGACAALARHFPHQKDYIDALRADLRAWVDSIVDGTPSPLATAVDGLRASAVADAVHTSMRQGGGTVAVTGT